MFTNLFTLHLMDFVMTVAVMSTGAANFTLAIDADGFFDETFQLGKQLGTLVSAAVDYDPFRVWTEVDIKPVV